jgi:hypothetical protein
MTRRDRRRRWWIGLVTGVAGGAGTLLAGSIGGVLGIVAILLAVAETPRGGAVGGVLVGLGAAWLVLFGRAVVGCREDCVAPDLAPWLAIAVVLLALGIVVSVRARRGP